MNPDPFAAVRANKSPEQEDPFASVRVKKQSPQKTNRIPELPDAQRQRLQMLSRGAEAFLGAPRALGEFGESIVPEKLIKKGAEKIGLREPIEKGFELAKKYAPYKLFPEKEQVREFTKDLFGGRLEPKNESEKKSGELFEDFVQLAIPVGGGPVKLARPLFTALGANIAKEGAEFFGASPETQDLAKLGALGIASFIQPKAAQKYYSEQYKLARQARPPDAKVSSPGLLPKLNILEKELERGGSETWKGKLFTKINELRSKVSGNEVDVEELEQFKPSVNRIIGELYVERNVPKPGIKSAQRYANKLASVIDRSLEDYGKINPEWAAHYRPANEAFGAYHQSQKAMDWLGRNFKKLGLSHAGAAALSSALIGAPKAIAGGVGTALAGYPVIKAGELASQLAKSPALRKNFLSLYKAALKQSIPAASQSAKRLEKDLQSSS